MVKQGDKKKEEAEKPKKMTPEEKLDYLIKSSEAYLKATSKVPTEIMKQYKEIHSMFTAMKGFTNQEFERMSNLETAFTAVVADLQEIKGAIKFLGATPTTPNATTPLVFTTIEALPLRDDIKRKLRLEVLQNGKRVIRCDWLGDDWQAVNKLVRQMGFQWVKEDKNSCWVEQ